MLREDSFFVARVVGFPGGAILEALQRCNVPQYILLTQDILTISPHPRTQVTDSGAGIPAAKLPLLFQAFSQVGLCACRYH